VPQATPRRLRLSAARSATSYAQTRPRENVGWPAPHFQASRLLRAAPGRQLNAAATKPRCGRRSVGDYLRHRPDYVKYDLTAMEIPGRAKRRSWPLTLYGSLRRGHGRAMDGPRHLLGNPPDNGRLTPRQYRQSDDVGGGGKALQWLTGRKLWRNNENGSIQWSPHADINQLAWKECESRLCNMTTSTSH